MCLSLLLLQEPPRFKTNKKLPRGPPSPPAPVLHSPPRKVTAEEQAEWKIPPCISNWKNARGYTIPLDKRLAADGRGLQDVHINDGFARLTEALYVVERQSREAIEMRAQIRDKAANKERELQEQKLRDLAQKAREERAGLRPAVEEVEEVRERDNIRHERARERERDRRIQAAAPDKRNKLMRDRDRDVSERVALGLPATSKYFQTSLCLILYFTAFSALFLSDLSTFLSISLRLSLFRLSLFRLSFLPLFSSVLYPLSFAPVQLAGNFHSETCRYGWRWIRRSAL